MAIGNVNGAPLEFSALILSDVRMSQTTLIDRIFRHYRQGVIQQLYKILGSIDFVSGLGPSVIFLIYYRSGTPWDFSRTSLLA